MHLKDNQRSQSSDYLDRGSQTYSSSILRTRKDKSSEGLFLVCLKSPRWSPIVDPFLAYKPLPEVRSATCHQNKKSEHFQNCQNKKQPSKPKQKNKQTKLKNQTHFMSLSLSCPRLTNLINSSLFQVSYRKKLYFIPTTLLFEFKTFVNRFFVFLCPFYIALYPTSVKTKRHM